MNGYAVERLNLDKTKSQNTALSAKHAKPPIIHGEKQIAIAICDHDPPWYKANCTFGMDIPIFNTTCEPDESNTLAKISKNSFRRMYLSLLGRRQ